MDFDEQGADSTQRDGGYSMVPNVEVVDAKANYGSHQKEAYSSGVSWAAVVGGAFTGAALALILVALGTGLGLSSISPWSNSGASASTVGKAAVIWLIVTQIVASAMAGYLTGRLRTKWATIHGDEVYFRDTANGFLAWAVGMVITAAFLASAATNLMGGVAQVGATSSSSTGRTGQGDHADNYFVDSLFRSEHPSSTNDGSANDEAGRILTRGLKKGEVPEADKTYLAHSVA